MKNVNAEVFCYHRRSWLILLAVLAFIAMLLTACGVKKVQVSAVTSGEVRLSGGKPVEIAFSEEETREMYDFVIENLEELEEDGEVYESIEDIWPDYPTKEDFMWNEEEY